MSITHEYVAGGAAPGARVGADEWDAEHFLEDGSLALEKLAAEGELSSTTFLRRDGVWAVPPGTGGGGGTDLGFQNVKAHGAVGNGSTDDRIAIQQAVDAAAAGGGVVWFPPGHYAINSTTTNGSGETCGISVVGSRVWLVGAGKGAGRSGNGGSGGVSIIRSATAMTRLVSFDSANNSPASGSPDWRGGGIRGLHLCNRTASDSGGSSTGSANIDSAVDVRGLNNFWILECSISHFRKTGGIAGTGILLRNARGGSPLGEPTQYGRGMFNDIWNCNHGIRGEKTGTGSRPPIPDWQFGYNAIMTITGHPRPDLGGGATGPIEGSRGIYVNSNAVRIFNNEIQFWDYGVDVDCASNGFGRHITVKENHFEADTGWAAAAANANVAVSNPSVGEQQCILIVDNESANVGKYQDVIRVGGTNVEELRVRNHRIRDIAWITSANQASYIAANGATVDIA